MKKASVIWLVLVQWVLAFEWLHSGWGKWSDPAFITNIGKTLTAFAAKNPSPWYTNFLNNTALPHAETFGNAIRTGELSVGIVLALMGLLLLAKKRLAPAGVWIMIIALFAAALMNLNFYLAAGWTSPSTSGINVVMGLIHIVLALYYVCNRKELTS